MTARRRYVLDKNIVARLRQRHTADQTAWDAAARIEALQRQVAREAAEHQSWKILADRSRERAESAEATARSLGEEAAELREALDAEIILRRNETRSLGEALERARDALRRYGAHDDTCYANDTVARCTCGLQDTLTTKEAT